MGRLVTSYGVRIGIRTNSEEVLERAVERLPVGTRPILGRTSRHLYSLLDGGPPKHRGLRSFSLLYRNASRIARSLELGDVLGALEFDLRATIARHAPRRVFLRGDAVLLEGTVIVIVDCQTSSADDGKAEAPHLAGALTGALADLGATRLTRDFTPLDRRGRLTEFRAGGGSLVQPESYRVALVVCARDAKRSGTSLERLSPAFAMSELIATVATTCKLPVAIATAKTLARCSTIVRLCQTDAVESAVEIANLTRAFSHTKGTRT